MCMYIINFILGPPNEFFNECGSSCEPTCENQQVVSCSMSCHSKCVCNQDYIRNQNGVCVPKDQC